MPKRDLTQVSFWLSGIFSLCALTACSNSGSSTGGGSSTGDSTKAASEPANARDLFYHDLSAGSGGASSAGSGASSGNTSGNASASGSGSGSGSGSSSGSGGTGGGGSAGKMAAAVCWEIRSNDMGPSSIMCHTFPKNGFKQGDGLRFHFRPSVPCYAYIVLCKGSSGKEAQLLYPPSGVDDRLEAGKEYSVPESGMLEFDNKPGEEILGFCLSPVPISTKKALEVGTQPTMVEPNKFSAGQKTESGPLSLFAASDQTVAASDYKSTDRSDAEHDPFVYVDNAKDPANPIVVGIGFPHT